MGLNGGEYLEDRLEEGDDDTGGMRVIAGLQFGEGLPQVPEGIQGQKIEHCKQMALGDELKINSIAGGDDQLPSCSRGPP